MLTKTDRRANVRHKRKYKRVQHWIWAHSPNFIACEKLEKNKMKRNKIKI